MADIIIDGTIGANRLLLLDSTGKIPAVDGSQVTTIAAGNIATGTIPIARIDTGTTANKIVKLDGNAKLPAVDGSLITNVPGATKNSSDPTISTNPSGGVGTEWHNTTSGEAYICTDATAGKNKWISIGGGSGNINVLYGGTSFGYYAGGNLTTPSGHNSSKIEKFSFTSDANAVDTTADLVKGVRYGAGSTSTTNGYAISGHNGANGSPANSYITDIQKWSFASTANATVGAVSLHAGEGCGGHSSPDYGYTSAFYTSAPQNYIQKFTFASDNDATDVGDMLTGMYACATASDWDNSYGYHAGSHSPYNVIQKFSFTSDGNATDVADLLSSWGNASGNSSNIHGYISGGNRHASGNYSNVIEKWSFSTASNSTDVGDLPVGVFNQGTPGCSSTTYGYRTAGTASGGTRTNIIEKWSFSTDGNGTDVGDFTENKNWGANAHV